jgi:hypothetical protein
MPIGALWLYASASRLNMSLHTQEDSFLMSLQSLFTGLVMMLALAGCGGGSNNPGGPIGGSLAEHIVAPATTDATIDNWLDDHYAYRDMRSSARGRLLVYLPGSHGKPVNGQRYMKEMAAAGNHVIGLRYPNSWEVINLCASDPDLTCFENVRLEIVDGIDRSALVAVNASNSIINRLIKLLQYLDLAYPTEGWNQYLDSGQPVWSRLILSGHSQGAGHAAVIGKYYVLDRVLMFGAPGDFNSYGAAPWQDRNHVTSTAGYFGFNHDRDSLAAKLAAWTLLGLDDYGAAIAVDSVAAPYNNTHMLRSDALPETGSYDDAHGSVLTDDKTPLLPDGTPLFAPVWRYMCCT